MFGFTGLYWTCVLWVALLMRGARGIFDTSNPRLRTKLSGVDRRLNDLTTRVLTLTKRVDQHNRAEEVAQRIVRELSGKLDEVAGKTTFSAINFNCCQCFHN